ncbi:2-hydroxycarboxylate transporter family protein [Pectobacterium quasiaquaticum]|uniref:2-hydroxycarboxylate transporter family protein n=1 Tax=Pectobacterium quasiaquaticum TaxID=2774015 RepID=A0A9Q2EQZ0_9GAMM|nr:MULTISPECIES: 2-hydroxycarboxylate transporter family protein [Pectobacterium]MBE5203043.1 2-hydroxycarboxylate transporter family protein [Pectobacterium quasiaquaticum]MBE5209139.1 2-hydroxycarboxylate transporter family protein [Pectobacterium quasiaquaticum]MBE5213147.1 2-hydroxycarboxylate transporter family protein [Pectobacterium quasiaquaticum]MBE5223413.1 2-hydroxycarboxylate transporter family protein [Pectobacterium quasiaquaticum]MBE5224203.1 2-hydroxycarboxylate transporter fam
MSTTDDSYIVVNNEAAGKASLKEKWWHVLDTYKVGIIPVPLFVLAGVLIGIDCLSGKLPSDIVVMVATLAFFGFACGEFGKRLPIIGKMGAAAICATFIPSAMVHYGLLPDVVVESTTKFYKSTNILYLYICCIIVGSIMSMNRQTLIQGFLRIFFPMLCGEVAGMLVGMGVGMALGLDPFQIFFFLILPIMAGGVGEGAIPLSIGYATILHMDQGVALGRVLPIVMLGSLTAIILAGVLNQLGKRFPHLTGEGELMPNKDNSLGSGASSTPVSAFSGKADVTTIASGALLAILLYMVGMLGHKVIGLPAPVGMLFAAVLVKLAHGVSPKMLEGSQVVYKFFQTSVTYPILFAVGVAITPWQELVNAFTIQNLLVIISTVVTLVATGFFVGRKIGMHPIDVAIISCCQSGQGGTGDVAILTAGNRMVLMPFAQIATRIGGAINVSISLLVLANFLV